MIVFYCVPVTLILVPYFPYNEIIENKKVEKSIDSRII